MVYDTIIISLNSTDKVPAGFLSVGPGSFEFVKYSENVVMLEVTQNNGTDKFSINAFEVYTVSGVNPRD